MTTTCKDPVELAQLAVDRGDLPKVEIRGKYFLQPAGVRKELFVDGSSCGPWPSALGTRFVELCVKSGAALVTIEHRGLQSDELILDKEEFLFDCGASHEAFKQVAQDQRIDILIDLGWWEAIQWGVSYSAFDALGEHEPVPLTLVFGKLSAELTRGALLSLTPIDQLAPERSEIGL